DTEMGEPAHISAQWSSLPPRVERGVLSKLFEEPSFLRCQGRWHPDLGLGVEVAGFATAVRHAMPLQSEPTAGGGAGGHIDGGRASRGIHPNRRPESGFPWRKRQGGRKITTRHPIARVRR